MVVKNNFISKIGGEIKSLLYGNPAIPSGAYSPVQDNAYYEPDGLFQLIGSNQFFGRSSLRYLIEEFYARTPAFGVINKILLAQRNINFVPYWKGKPWKSKTFNFDIFFALEMLITTGSCILYKRDADTLDVINTLDVDEVPVGSTFNYRLQLRGGRSETLNITQMHIIKFIDISRHLTTGLGLSPFQAASLPLEALKQMYIADTSLLKNKGADMLLTNDSDFPIVDDERGSATDALNAEIAGARHTGRVAMTTSKLRGIVLGRTAKELSLWEGFKYKFRDLCTVLQVDSGLFNDPDNKKYANVQEANRALYNDCVVPFTRYITEDPTFKAMLGYDVYLDTSQIDCLQEAQNTRAERAKTTTEAIVGLNSDVLAGTITADIAVKILVDQWNFDEQEARDMISNSKPIEPVVDTTQIKFPDLDKILKEMDLGKKINLAFFN